MKKYLLYAVLISFAFSSCKKENTTPIPTPQGQSNKHNIAFSVTGFSTSQAPFQTYAVAQTKLASTTQVTTTATKDSLIKSIGVLYYTITDSKGALVSQVTQLAADSTFGTLKASLAPGSYHVSIVGGEHQKRSAFSSLTPNPDTTSQFIYQDIHRVGKLTSFGDTFMKLMDITVGNSSGNYNVTLDRIVSRIMINIQDAIPANVNSISVSIINDRYILNACGSSQGSTSADAGLGKVLNGVTFFPTAGATNTKATRIVLNTESAMTVKITCLDSQLNVIATKTINNVTCQANHTTLLTGNLFTGSSGGGIGVTYNTAWNVQTLNYSF